MLNSIPSDEIWWWIVVRISSISLSLITAESLFSILPVQRSAGDIFNLDSRRVYEETSSEHLCTRAAVAESFLVGAHLDNRTRMLRI